MRLFVLTHQYYSEDTFANAIFFRKDQNEHNLNQKSWK